MPNPTFPTAIDQPTPTTVLPQHILPIPVVPRPVVAGPVAAEARRAEQVARPALSQTPSILEQAEPLRISEVPPGAQAVEAAAANARITTQAVPQTVFDLSAREAKAVESKQEEAPRTLMDMIDRLYVLLLQAHHRFSEHNRMKEDKEKERFNAYTETITSNTKSTGFAKMLIAGLALATSIGGNALISYVNPDDAARRRDENLIKLLSESVPGLTEYFPRSYEAASANASSKQSLSSTKLQKMMNDDQQFKTLVDQIRQQYQKVLQEIEQAAGQR